MEEPSRQCSGIPTALRQLFQEFSRLFGLLADVSVFEVSEASSSSQAESGSGYSVSRPGTGGNIAEAQCSRAVGVSGDGELGTGDAAAAGRRCAFRIQAGSDVSRANDSAAGPAGDATKPRTCTPVDSGKNSASLGNLSTFPAASRDSSGNSKITKTADSGGPVDFIVAHERLTVIGNTQAT
ncbi:hypothetical protein CSOJ01_09242 [Colletotrichum sojae]|uniref:Uncharacterized protein n=1 Tax=Colletotrichum sojae TaxID=2175907 RepID=A0A8H6J3R0_9PEZI|nr:hypothetical protein CSOJ01_09242 [Colletotrichum sojae]